MRRHRVIRCGQRDPRKSLPTISQKDVDCLEGFWSLEEQLGIRAKPTTNLLNDIPPIVLDKDGGTDG